MILFSLPPPQLRVVDLVPADPDGGGDGHVLPRVDPLEAALFALCLRHPLRRLLLRRRRPVRTHDVAGKKERRDTGFCRQVVHFLGGPLGITSNFEA